MIEKGINIAMLFVMPFLFTGIIAKVKAWWGGRKGPRVIQPFFDCARLFRKGEVISTTTSYVFRVSPSVNLAAVIAAGLLVPICDHKSFVSFSGDFIVFAYILALAKFLNVSAAFDTGSSFEGMGAAREAAFSSLVEPALFIIFSALAMLCSCFSFEGFFSTVNSSSVSGSMAVLGILAFFIILLVEGCRVPVDDPNTHLELTMVHEVMVLDNSGPDLAFINFASAMKMTVITFLMAQFIIPVNAGIWGSLGLLIVFTAATAVIIGTVESLLARFRMTHVPQFIFFSSMAALIMAFVVAFFNL